MGSTSSRRFKNVSFLLTVILWLVVEKVVGIEDNIPEFFTLNVKRVSNETQNNVSYTRVLFDVQGRNLYPKMRVKVTHNMSQRNAVCRDADFVYNISEIQTDQKWAQYNLTVPLGVGGNLYFCLPHQTRENQIGLIKSNILDSAVYEWFHQGPSVIVPLGGKNIDKK